MCICSFGYFVSNTSLWFILGYRLRCNILLAACAFYPLASKVIVGYANVYVHKSLIYKVGCPITNTLGSKKQQGILHMLMRSKFTNQGQRSSEVKLGGKYWFLLGLLWKLEIWNQTWVKDAKWFPLCVNEVEGHVLWSRVSWSWDKWKM